MRIILDVDGVIADCIKQVVEGLNKRFHTNYTHDDIKTFDFMNESSGILTKEQCSYAKKLFSEDGFAENLFPIKGAVEATKKMIESENEVLFVTSQWYASNTWCKDRYQWLVNFFGKENVDNNLNFNHNKALIPADVFIDDKIENCKDYKTAHPSAHVVLFKQPWNAILSEEMAVKTCVCDEVMDGWKNSSSLFEKIENKEIGKMKSGTLEIERNKWFPADGPESNNRLFYGEALSLMLLTETIVPLWATVEEGIKTIGLYVGCNDVFYWGCADAEPLPTIGFTEENDEEFWDLYEKDRTLGVWGGAIWCCMRRGMRPQKPVIKILKDLNLWSEELEALPERDG